MRESEKCGCRSIGSTCDEGGEGMEAKAAYAEIHEVAGCEHGEDVTPAKIAVFAGEEVNDNEGIVLGSQRRRFWHATHVSAPVFGWQFVQGFCKGFAAFVKFCAGVASENYIACDEDMIEITGSEQGKKRQGVPMGAIGNG